MRAGKCWFQCSLAILPLAILPVAVALQGCREEAVQVEPIQANADFEQAQKAAETVVSALTGNGAPAGAHYNLNVIGVPKAKTADMTGDEGRRIFVSLSGKIQILLSPGEFAVLDANGTDGSAAFQMPSPDPDNDGVTEYSVFARALGKPGGSATMTLCAEDPTTLDTFCSIYSVVPVREKGKNSFTNVSRELLYAFVDLNGDGQVERIPIFDPALQGYFWGYDNNGLKLCNCGSTRYPRT